MPTLRVMLSQHRYYEIDNNQAKTEMKVQIDNTKLSYNKKSVSEQKDNSKSKLQLQDNRPEALTQKKITEIVYGNSQFTEKSSFSKGYDILTNYNSKTTQRTINKDQKTRLNDLNSLNAALSNLSPQVPAISVNSFPGTGVTSQILDRAIKGDNTPIYDSMSTTDVINLYTNSIQNLVNSLAPTFNYDPHGDKHFTGVKSQGSQFSKGSQSSVNPKLEQIIQKEIGRIRRDANMSNQTYYLTCASISESNGDNVTIQVDYNYAADSVTYHGYPDSNTTTHVLSRTKGGSSIP